MEAAVLLFNDYETLDVFGPVEILGRLKEYYSLAFYSVDGGLIKNHHGVSILTNKLEEINNVIEILLIPGGIGTREAVLDLKFIDVIRKIANQSKYVLTVCTGSALLAKTGLLDGRAATSNKKAMTWAMTNGENVNWNKTARWTVDEKYYTSSGVSAGMDMTLGFLSDRHGYDFAKKAAIEIEYNWIDDKDNDTFQAK
jgi:putative intracellular protease/amidase